MTANASLDGTSRRRILIAGVGTIAGAGVTALAAAPGSAGAQATAHAPRTGGARSKTAGTLTSETYTTRDGTVLYYKDWGTGPAVVFCHGYPLSSDAWEDQMMFLVQQGFRVIAHDRRGFGRSSQPSGGYDFDTFADDLAELVEALDIRNATFVGHSMGGGEVARYIGRHGQQRVAKVALVSAVTPFLLKTPTNPNGAPRELFDTFRSAVQAGRSQWNKDVSMPYYSFNRPGAKVSEGLRDSYWRQGMATGMLAAYHAIGAFSETDFREDLKNIRVPTLIVHGDDDQIVPIEISGNVSAQLVSGARLIVYKGGSHGLLHVNKDRLNSDLLAFLKA